MYYDTYMRTRVDSLGIVMRVRSRLVMAGDLRNLGRATGFFINAIHFMSYSHVPDDLLFVFDHVYVNATLAHS